MILCREGTPQAHTLPASGCRRGPTDPWDSFRIQEASESRTRTRPARSILTLTHLLCRFATLVSNTAYHRCMLRG